MKIEPKWKMHFEFFEHALDVDFDNFPVVADVEREIDSLIGSLNYLNFDLLGWIPSSTLIEGEFKGQICVAEYDEDQDCEGDEQVIAIESVVRPETPVEIAERRSYDQSPR